MSYASSHTGKNKRYARLFFSPVLHCFPEWALKMWDVCARKINRIKKKKKIKTSDCVRIAVDSVQPHVIVIYWRTLSSSLPSGICVLSSENGFLTACRRLLALCWNCCCSCILFLWKSSVQSSQNEPLFFIVIFIHPVHRLANWIAAAQVRREESSYEASYSRTTT